MISSAGKIGIAWDTAMIWHARPNPTCVINMNMLIDNMCRKVSSPAACYAYENGMLSSIQNISSYEQNGGLSQTEWGRVPLRSVTSG